MLGQRRRRWANIKQIQDQRLIARLTKGCDLQQITFFTVIFKTCTIYIVGSDGLMS